MDNKYNGLLQEETEDGVVINLSDVLLDECLQRIESIRKMVGFTFVTLSSTDEGYHLYKRNAFEDLEEDISFSVEEGDSTSRPMFRTIDLEE